MIPQNYPLYTHNDDNEWFLILGWAKSPEKGLSVRQYVPLVPPLSWDVPRALLYMGPLESFTTTAPDLTKDDND